MIWNSIITSKTTPRATWWHDTELWHQRDPIATGHRFGKIPDQICDAMRWSKDEDIYIYIERESVCIRARMHAYTSCNFAAWKYLRNFDIPPCGTFGQKGDRQPNKAPGRRTPDAQSPTGHPPTTRAQSRPVGGRQKAHSRLNRQRQKGAWRSEMPCGSQRWQREILLRKAMRGEDDYVTMYLWPRNIPLLSLATAG